MIAGTPLWPVTFVCRCGYAFIEYVPARTYSYPCPRCAGLASMRTPCCPPWGWA